MHAISDLHLPDGQMWNPSAVDLDTLAARWRRVVGDDDIVLMPGDHLGFCEDLDAQMAYVDALPGRKALIAGNHDLQICGSLRRFKALARRYETLTAIGGDAQLMELPDRPYGLVVCGTTGGWPQRMHRSEIRRLRSTLQAATALANGQHPIAAMLHYPPCGAGSPQRSPVCRALAEAGVSMAVYGHVHQPQMWPRLLQGWWGAARYSLVAADAVGFSPAPMAIAGKRRLRVLG